MCSWIWRAVSSYLADFAHPLDQDRVSSRKKLLRKVSVIGDPALNTFGFRYEVPIRAIEYALAPQLSAVELDDNFGSTCGTRSVVECAERRGKIKLMWAE